MKNFVLATALSALTLAATPAFARSFTEQVLHAVVSGSHSSGKDAKPANRSAQELANLYSAGQNDLSFKACADQFPNGQPLSLATVPAAMRPVALCSDHFAVLYSGKSKTPLVVVEKLNRRQVADAKGEERTNQFYPDPRLPRTERAELSDFKGSGFDRGHQSPAGDAPDAKSMAQSFALSNMVAQDPTNNQKTWNKLEGDVRKFAGRAGGDVFVYTGPLFSAQHATIGRNAVWVPTHLYKLVYDQASHRAWAYVLPNTASAQVEAPVDYATFVKMTGLAVLGNNPVSGSIR